MRPLLFAANWKMHIGPAEARAFAAHIVGSVPPRAGRSLWFFPPAVSLEATAQGFAGRDDIQVGAQDVHWEPKGAFTGAISVPLARAAGAVGALVGHSERRHVFGETDAETAKKVRALLGGGMTPMLCVGETLEQREAGETDVVCARQLRAALEGLSADELAKVTIAYEPVWAIGTGKNATPADAAAAHRAIRGVLATLGRVGRATVLYGGSVNAGNLGALLAEDELDGVLVGGA
ncbi:MAG TPA: triose-phosphate isomerase, partial [Gemmatimonadales bacterium]|nr:triose-phosphate isomerase [Gemmatimonadales bacterium]